MPAHVPGISSISRSQTKHAHPGGKVEGRQSMPPPHSGLNKDTWSQRDCMYSNNINGLFNKLTLTPAPRPSQQKNLYHFFHLGQLRFSSISCASSTERLKSRRPVSMSISLLRTMRVRNHSL